MRYIGGMVKIPSLRVSAATPQVVFAVVLLLVFVIEGAIMLVLPYTVPWKRGSLAESVADASALALLLAPAVWYVVVRPLRELSDQRRELLRRLVDGLEQERSRVARDLHDELGQRLTAIVVGLRTIEGSADAEEAKARARGLREVASESLDDVRRISRGLRPTGLVGAGLAPAIERLCKDVLTPGGVEWTIESRLPAGVVLREAVEATAYRIAQEAVTNISRHAHASRVAVSLSLHAGELVLNIEDDGVGLESGRDGRPVEGVGLAGMRERAALVEGSLEVDSEPGKGLKLRAILPRALDTDA